MLRASPAQEDIPADPAQIARIGRVLSVDLAEGTCIVVLGDPDSDDGEMESPAIPFAAARAGDTRVWLPPSVGEQVLLFCPEGDLALAVALGGLWSDSNPAPGSSARALIRFGDEGTFAYDPENHHADIDLPAGATLAINAQGGVTITGPVSINGDVTVTGTLTASEDVVGGGKSLKTHRHTGVQAGGGISGAPQ